MPELVTVPERPSSVTAAAFVQPATWVQPSALADARYRSLALMLLVISEVIDPAPSWALSCPRVTLAAASPW